MKALTRSWPFRYTCETITKETHVMLHKNALMTMLAQAALNPGAHDPALSEAATATARYAVET